jgi:cobalt-zinc-cadmium efflux system membrane fusion protein
MKYSIIILSLGLLVSCSANHSPEVSNRISDSSVVRLTAAQQKQAGLITDTLQIRNMSGVLHVNGRIDVPPQNMVSISMPLGGYLKSTRLLPGMHVRKGEDIAVLEDQQYIQLQQDYLVAQARQSFLEKDYQRQQELNQSRSNSDKSFQQTSAEYASIRAQVQALAEKLRLAGIRPDRVTANTITPQITLHAPIDGYVTRVNVNIGKYVAPTDVLFELVNPDDIHLALNLFEKDLNQVSIDQKVTAYTNYAPDKKYTCSVILIGKQLSADRSTEVHCHFHEYDHQLLPGMYMNADIELKNKAVKAVPAEAVVVYHQQAYVFVQKGEGLFEQVPVTTGISEDGWLELLQPETLDGKQVVVKGAYSLLMAHYNAAEEE